MAHGFAASCGAGWVTGFASSYCRAPGECPVWKPPVVPHPAGVECKKLELSTLGIPLALYNTKKQSLQLRSGEIPKDEFAGTAHVKTRNVVDPCRVAAVEMLAVDFDAAVSNEKKTVPLIGKVVRE